LTKSNRFACSAILACVALPASLFASVTYTDSTFATASYPTVFTYIDNITGTVSVTSGPAQCTSCGDPGNALEAIFNWGGAPEVNATLVLGVINSAFTYDPSTQGALWNISTSIDASEANTMGYPPDPYYFLLIEQDSNYYYGLVNFDSNQSGFQLLSATGLVALNFAQFNPSTGVTTSSSNPNFNGDTMEFGLYMIEGALFAPANSATLTYDNLTLQLNSVPEPSSLFLMAAALAGLTLLRRRKLE
jgi:hypothetical protein